MLLVIHDLPSNIKYADIKLLIKNKCFIEDVILDKLVKEGATGKKVTVGVAKEEDATRIFNRLNGTYVEGKQIFIEPVKKSQSDNNSAMPTDMNAYSTYEPPQNNQNQMMASYPPLNNQNAWNMQMYGYGMPDMAMAFQAGMNPQMMQGYGEYNAWMTSGNPPMTQSNVMGCGSQQMQQGSQYPTTQGQFELIGPGSQPMGSQKESGYGHTPGNRSNERGYQRGQQGSQYSTTQGQFERSGPGPQPMGLQKKSGYGHTPGNRSNERRYKSDTQNETGFSSGKSRDETGYGSGNRDEMGYSSQQSYSNTQKDRGFGSQGFLGGSRQDDRDRGSQPSWGRSQQEDRGRRSPQPLMGSNQRGFSSGDLDKDQFGTGNQREFGGQYYTENSQRENRDLSLDSWENRDRGLDKPRGANEMPRGRDRDRPRGMDDGRKRRYSLERGNTHKGNSRDGFQSNSGFEGNQSRDFVRDSRDFSPAGPTRDSHPANPVPKPLLGVPSLSNSQPRPYGRDSHPANPVPKPMLGVSSWSNSQPRPFGSDKPDFNKGPTRDHSKGSIQWNRNTGPPLSHSSPVKDPPPKRPKIQSAMRVVVKNYDYDQKLIQRAKSARGEGVASIADEIFKAREQEFSRGKKAYQFGIRLLKKKIHDQLDEIIKQKYPENPYPVLSGREIVELYREHHPVGDDHKLFKFVFKETVKELPSTNDNTKPNVAGTSAKLMGPPSNTRVPHVKTNSSPVKPNVPVKSVGKPTLADLLPPKVRQEQPVKPARPWVTPRLNKFTMLGPNALKNKPKPYNVEKRKRTLQKQLAKREFLEEKLYKCETPEKEKALNETLDELTYVFNAAIDDYPTTNPEEKLVGASIQEKAAPEFRAMVRLHTIKRLLNITSTLMLRIFVSGGKATKDNVEAALKPYGVVDLKSSTQARTQMFTASVKKYFNFDRLCNSPGIPVPGKHGTSTITAKPLHLIIPYKFRRLLNKKDEELTGDYDGDEYFDEDEGGDGDDYDDDDDLHGDADDDDVIEVIKDEEVIELSGDETTLNVPNEGNGDGKEVNTKSQIQEANKRAEVNISNASKNNTVDLTLKGEEDETVDDNMSAAIEEEIGDSVVEIDEEEIREDDLEDY